MKKEKPNRIYIFVPRTLQTKRGVRLMPNGRAAAQCAHIAAAMVQSGYKNIAQMTTIILAAASSGHLEQIKKILTRFKLKHHFQYDTFEDDDNLLLQAIAVGPLTKKQSEVFQFSELW